VVANRTRRHVLIYKIAKYSLAAAANKAKKHKNLFIFNIFIKLFKCLSFEIGRNLNALLPFCQLMSNHCERISSTARYFDSTLTFDFWEASLPLQQDRFERRIVYSNKTVFFIINTIVLELLKLMAKAV
jgi:hypothetical protein